MPKIDPYDGVRDAEADLERARRKYLTDAGWRYSSDNPTCCWLWEKKLADGRTILVNIETASHLQSMLDAVR